MAFSHPVSEAQIVVSVREFVDVRAEELGCVTTLHDNTQNNNLDDQLAAVDAWIAQGVDAMVVYPIDTAALDPARVRAQEAGIKFLTYATPMEGADGFAGFNHEESGAIVGQAAVDWVKANNVESPKALIYTLTGIPALSPRWEGVEKLFEENGIEVVAIQDAASIDQGISIAETVIQQHPDLDIIIGYNDDSAIGALQAVANSDLDPEKVFIGGQDGSLEGLLAIDEGGAYRASAAIRIDDLGKNVTDIAINAVAGTGPSWAFASTSLAEKADQAALDDLIANYN